MDKNQRLKILAVATVFLSVLPAITYYLANFKQVRSNNHIVSAQELIMFFVIGAIASLCHLGVSFAQSSVAVGGAFFMVSVFIHLTKIAALILFYKANKSEDSYKDYWVSGR